MLSVSLFDDDEQRPTAVSPVCKISEPVFLSSLAHTRHSWLGEWQSFDYTAPRQQQHHTDDLAMQQYRFFGGEPGDDTNLCYNMLDFFGRLDYIDT